VRAIYVPRGRAGEYAPLAANLYQGCAAGCRYCYARAIRQRAHGDQDTHCPPRPGILQALERDARKLAGGKAPVFLCFTTDPYPERSETTRDALGILQANGMRANVLTKAGWRASRDFDILLATDSLFGVSLSWISESAMRQWEPRAGSVSARLTVLEEARSRGIRTWVSIEPVVDPLQALGAISAASRYVDCIAVGKWNHSEEARAIDWRTFVHQASTLLFRLGVPYVFKADLRPYLPAGAPGDTSAGFLRGPGSDETPA